MDYGLIGERLGHSYSPQIHALLGNDRYELRPIPPEELDAFLRARNFRGLNVTIPYKQAVLPYCAQLSDTAREIGSVNTLVVRPDGSLLGHNTDIGGFTTMLREAGIDPAGKKAVVLGSGGTSLTARTALRRMGAREIVVVSRRGPVTYDALYAEHADAQLLVNATPVGMYPKHRRFARGARPPAEPVGRGGRDLQSRKNGADSGRAGPGHSRRVGTDHAGGPGARGRRVVLRPPGAWRGGAHASAARFAPRC